MKKIILALSLVFLFVCVFAISVSAQNRTSIEYKDANGIIHTVPVVKYDDATAETVAGKLNNNATVQTRFIDNGAYSIIKATDGTLTAYPTWYLIEPSGSSADYVAISEIEYDYVISKSGKTYNRGAMVYVEFPEGMTHARANSVFGKKNGGNPYETNITDMYFPSTLVAFEIESFNSMPNLKSVYIEPGNKVKSIPSSTFSNSTVEYIQFENFTELETLDGVTNTKLKGDIDLSKTKLKTIKKSAFNQCKNMGKITLPNSVEVIEDSAFENTGSAYLASPYLPSSLTFIGKRFFAYNDNLLDTYIFPEGVTSLADEPFQDSKVAGGPEGKELNLIFLGKVTGVVYLNGNGHQKHAEKVSVYFAQNTKEEYNTNGFYIKPSGSSITSVPGAIRAVFCSGTGAGTNGNVTGLEYIYITNVNGAVHTDDMVNDATNGFDFDNHRHFGAQNLTPATCGENGLRGISCIVCDKNVGEVIPATGDHQYTDDCDCSTATVCTVCNQTIVETLEHIIGTVYKYDNGYSNEGLKVVGCVRDGCEHGERTTLDALIVSLGYSKEEDGVGITHTAKINREAILEYQAFLSSEKGENVKAMYGVIAAIDDKNGTPITAYGTLAEGYKAAFTDNSNTAYTILTVKLCGITDTTQKLNLGAYIIIDGNVNYIYGLTKQTSNKAESVSYSDL